MTGWIKLHRCLLDWEWYHDSKTLHLWIHILTKANHAAKQWRGKTIESGQFVTGREKLSLETGISEQSIRTILKRLISTSNITIKTTNKFSIISVCNWEHYQCDSDDNNKQINQESNQQLTNNQPTTNQQLTTTKNVKKDKNVKKKEKKSAYAELVTLTAGEYQKLKEKYPTQYDLDRGIELLNNYKAAHGKKYKSDYHVMIGWVYENVRKEAVQAGMPFEKPKEEPGLFGDLP